MDPDRRRALSDFYREEFLRQFEQLDDFVTGPSREAMGRAYRKVMQDLDSVCGRADFPAVAETLLQQFDVLTRLSERDPRRGH